MTSAMKIMWARTLGILRSSYTTAFAYAGFLAGAGALFAFALEAAEGGTESLAVVWTSSAAPVVPLLAAVLSMDLWSEELRTGRISMLLSTPVRERELVIGKFMGAWTATVFGLVIFLATSIGFMAAFAPALLSRVSVLGFVPGLLALALQSALWCAVSLAASAATKSVAVSGLLSVSLTTLLPRGIWLAILAWSPTGRQELGAMPIDANATDMACGLVSSATVLTYLGLTLFALFVNSKLVACARLVGRGARQLRMSTAFTIVASAVLAASSITLVHRLDAKLDIPVGGTERKTFSARTRNILSEVRGELAISAFMSRKDPHFRQTAHLLRSLSREAESVGGVRIQVRYVDPVWDIGSAERLVREGASRDSLVFERGRLKAYLPLSEGVDERKCTSAIVRLCMPPQRRTVYWTHGHGESSFDEYGDFGMSDIARELVGDGYRNLPIDLSDKDQIPSDCALIVMAGATHDFSRAELGRLDSYLKTGGRLLLLMGSSESGGMTSLLSTWGIKPSPLPISDGPTITGTDIVISDFAEHPVSAPLRGSQVILERPITFTPSAAASESGTAVDRIGYSELALSQGRCVAAVAERGAGTGEDVALRPTRIITVGDDTFVANAQLESRANANRDFFLNCVAYLSGSAAVAEDGTRTDRLVTGLDRDGRGRLLVFSSAILPAAVFVLLALFIASGRRNP